MPRNTEDFLTGSYKREYSDGTEYITGTGENAIGTQSGAYLKVEPPKTRYMLPSSAYGEVDNWDEVSDLGAKVWASKNADEKGNVPLFDIIHKPPVLDYMIATKDAAGSNPTAANLATHALEETKRRYGEPFWASDNTSEYATPFVNEAIKRGIIPGVVGQAPGEMARVGNYMGWSSAAERMQTAGTEFARNLDSNSWGWSPGTVQAISQAQIDTDKATLVQQLLSNLRSGKRSSATKGSPKDFRQEPLPGFKS